MRKSNDLSFNMKHIGIPLILGIVVVALYYTCLTGSFVWDDRTYFLDNDILPNLTPCDIGYIFASPSNYWGEHYPLRDFLFVSQHVLFGEKTAGYHIISILLYFGTGLIIFLLVKRLYDEFREDSQLVFKSAHQNLSALYVTIFFLLHPVHVETVAYISGQKDLLYALFSLFAIYTLYLRFKNEGLQNKTKKLLSLIFITTYYASFLSKGAAVATALFIPFFWLLFLRKQNDSILKAAGTWVLINIPTALWTLYSLNRVNPFLEGVNTAMWIPLFSRIIRAVKIFGAHSILAIKPFPLNFGYPFDDSIRLDFNFWAGLSVFALIIFSLALVWKKQKIISVGLLVYVIYMLPSLQITLQFGNAFIFDRYLYAPILGMGIIAERTLAKILIQPNRTVKFAALSSAMIILVSFCAITYSYIPKFRSDVDSTRHAYIHFPDWTPTAFNYVYSLIEAGKLDEAMEISVKEKTFSSPSWVRDYFVGWIHLEKGATKVAMPFLERSSSSSMKGGYYPFPNILLGRAFFSEKECSKAKTVLLQAMGANIYQPLQFYRAKKLLEKIEDSQ